MSRAYALALGLLVAGAGLARAQVTETQTTIVPPNAAVTTTDAAPAVTGTGELRRASQILGSTVRLQGQNNFGRVEDIVFDENGGLGYLVVHSNGRNVMLPYSAADINFGRRVVSYDIAPQAVQPLYFEQNAWPNVWAPQYTTRVQRIFPNAGVTRREVLRPVPAGAPAGGVIDEKVKVRPNGTVKVRERIR